MLTFRGLTQIVLDNASISPFPPAFRTLGSGFLPKLNEGALDLLTLALTGLAVAGLVVFSVRGRVLRRRYSVSDHPIGWFIARLGFLSGLILLVGFLLADYRGTPVVLVFLGLLTVAYSAIMQNSVFGRQVYAMGGNLAAAKLSGVNTARVSFLLLVNISVLSALAGLLFAAQLNLANPTNGVGFELDAIAAVFIGGAAVTGGIGTVGGAIIGGLIIGVLNNGMSILGVGQQYQALIKGLVLMAAVAFDVYNKRRTGR
jgi:putative multiple sugar transport system permease protein